MFTRIFYTVVVSLQLPVTLMMAFGVIKGMEGDVANNASDDINITDVIDIPEEIFLDTPTPAELSAIDEELNEHIGFLDAHIAGRAADTARKSRVSDVIRKNYTAYSDTRPF